jgi:hypothetical protein
LCKEKDIQSFEIKYFMGELNPISLKNFAHYNTLKNQRPHKPKTTLTPQPHTHKTQGKINSSKQLD